MGLKNTQCTSHSSPRAVSPSLITTTSHGNQPPMGDVRRLTSGVESPQRTHAGCATVHRSSTLAHQRDSSSVNSVSQLKPLNVASSRDEVQTGLSSLQNISNTASFNLSGRPSIKRTQCVLQRSNAYPQSPSATRSSVHGPILSESSLLPSSHANNVQTSHKYRSIEQRSPGEALNAFPTYPPSTDNVRHAVAIIGGAERSATASNNALNALQSHGNSTSIICSATLSGIEVPARPTSVHIQPSIGESSESADVFTDSPEVLLPALLIVPDEGRQKRAHSPTGSDSDATIVSPPRYSSHPCHTSVLHNDERIYRGTKSEKRIKQRQKKQRTDKDRSIENKYRKSVGDALEEVTDALDAIPGLPSTENASKAEKLSTAARVIRSVPQLIAQHGEKSGALETVILERDAYRERCNTVESELRDCREQLQRYMANYNTLEARYDVLMNETFP